MDEGQTLSGGLGRSTIRRPTLLMQEDPELLARVIYSISGRNPKVELLLQVILSTHPADVICCMRPTFRNTRGAGLA
jgi:hypothetical protein